MTKGAGIELDGGPRARAGRRRQWLHPMSIGLVVGSSLFGVGCFGQKPSGEATPSSAPQAPPSPPPPSSTALSPAPEPEKKGARPLDQPVPAAPAEGGATDFRATPAGAKPARKARSATAVEAPKASADREESIGGEPPEPGPLRQRLDRAYRAQSADCPSARDRKKAVCDLATQICSLTDRDPDVASVAEYCDDARRRCSEAERRTEERCPS